MTERTCVSTTTKICGNLNQTRGKLKSARVSQQQLKYVGSREIARERSELSARVFLLRIEHVGSWRARASLNNNLVCGKSGDRARERSRTERARLLFTNRARGKLKSVLMSLGNNSNIWNVRESARNLNRARACRQQLKAREAGERAQTFYFYFILYFSSWLKVMILHYKTRHNTVAL